MTDVEFWEAAYLAALRQTLDTVYAAQIADESLRHWKERWRK